MSEQWWYCLKHGSVESTPGCAHAERLGPYPSRALAEAALEQAASRSQAWEDDPRWRDDD